jgi:PEP-CTERM motif
MHKARWVAFEQGTGDDMQKRGNLIRWAGVALVVIGHFGIAHAAAPACQQAVVGQRYSAAPGDWGVCVSSGPLSMFVQLPYEDNMVDRLNGDVIVLEADQDHLRLVGVKSFEGGLYGQMETPHYLNQTAQVMVAPGFSRVSGSVELTGKVSTRGNVYISGMNADVTLPDGAHPFFISQTLRWFSSPPDAEVPTGDAPYIYGAGLPFVDANGYSAYGSASYTIDPLVMTAWVASVPEPSTWMQLGLGLGLLGVVGVRKGRRE